MPENSFHVQYDITKKSRLKKFYESNKILIFSFILILIIFFVSFSFYLESKKKKRILLSENYIQAKVYLENENKDDAIDILKSLIYANDATYSNLSFFLILDQNLITNFNELSVLFDHLLENNNFEKEVRNLLVYKRALLYSNFANESELLEKIKPLLNTENLWKPHALLLMGDYFVSKNEYQKAKEFYIQILSINNLQKNLYDEAKSRLNLISNE